MTRLIDAEALKVAIKKELPAMSNWGEHFIPMLIDNAPTVAEDYDTGYQDGIEDGLNDIRPKGKPIIRTNGYDMSNYYICSECHYSIDGWDKFCRNCGADMRSENEV